MTQQEIRVSPPPAFTPEFAPLPTRGLCPFTGLSRIGLYRLEAEGKIKLARLRRPGNLKGRTFIPVQPVLAYVRSAMVYGPQGEAAR